MRNDYKIVIVKPEREREREHSEDLGVDGNVILE
jgi:hypothetical protein